MRYFFLLMIVVLFGCHQPEKRTVAKKLLSRADSLSKKRAETERQFRKEHLTDSLKQDSALAKILRYAYNHLHSSYSDVDLKIWDDTTLFTTLTFGNIFSKDKKHLIVQNRVNKYEFNENVYLLDNSKFISVIKEVIPDLTFVVDSVADVNGDGHKDFLLNWYPESGCCARNVYGVYLYTAASGMFSKKYEFINPDFFPKEKVIRGVDYGHPGEVPLYKYKWNGLNVDTVEYIYPTDATRKKFYIVHHYGDEYDPKKRKVISAVPKEYRKIGGYEWFMLD